LLRVVQYILRVWVSALTRIKLQGRDFVRIGYDVDLPLVGSIAFGVIDRGTNLIQVRPNSYCVLNCIFCSTDAGPNSTWRKTEYYVSLDLMIDWVKIIAKFKGKGVEAHIDTVGDPLLYDRLPDLVHELKSIPEVSVVSLQTHGLTLTYKLADRLAAAGLDRVNLSIDTLDLEKAKYLQGVNYYNVRRVMDVTEYIVRSTSIDVLLAPLLLPGINDNDIPKIIEWGLRVGVGKKYPPFGIQIYLRHKHGRKPKNIRRMSWREFYELLRRWERRFNVKLILSVSDFGIVKRDMIPIAYRIGEKVRVKIVAPGWLKREWIAVPLRGPERVITVIMDDESNYLETRLSVRIIDNKHNIYLARPS